MTRGPALQPSLAAALVFSTSAAVLVLEILAARLLAPYVGVTLSETYTTIIGVVLAGIAWSWAGGRLADRVLPRRLLGLVAGGLLAMATLPVVRLLGEATDGSGAGDLPGLLAFFPPAAVLSAVVPTVVKLQLGRPGGDRRGGRAAVGASTWAPCAARSGPASRRGASPTP